MSEPLSAQLSDKGIMPPRGGWRLRPGASAKTLCPQCSKTRRNHEDPCLSVTVGQSGDDVVWKCHHCGWAGAAGGRKPGFFGATRREYKKPTWNPVPAAPPPYVAFWASRGISDDTLRSAGVTLATAWIPARGEKTYCIAFPYRVPGGEVVGVKYRTLKKEFGKEKDCKSTAYLWDLLDTSGVQAVICEGEIDALSLLEAGVENPLSVPDGATAAKADDAKSFDWLQDCADDLAGFKRVVLACDDDEPGRALAKELARRLGRHRCAMVKWPEGCKDANDVLVRHGSAALAMLVADAPGIPIPGIATADSFAGGVLERYRFGLKRGLTTGWRALDDWYRVRAGEMCIVSGIPSAGKSEFLDALAINMARNHGWKFGVCSLENQPEEHLIKLAEKLCGKSFTGFPKMSEDELKAALRWISEHIIFITPQADPDDPSVTLEWILELAKLTVARHGIRGLIIDPYNEIEHSRPVSVSETEYINQFLHKLRRWLQHYEVAGWCVAHPAKLPPERMEKAIGMYDINGSAAWYNKADCGIIVHRPEKDTDEIAIVVRKARHKESGRRGEATLKYDRITGRYYCQDEELPTESWLPEEKEGEV